MLKRTRLPVLIIVFVLIALFATPVFAAPPSNDNRSSALALHLPESGTIADIEEATLETDEPTASCATDGIDDDSVWFRVNVPAGTLTFETTTAEANFDTVISMFEVPRSGVLTSDMELACAVNPGNAATLSIVVSGGQYFVRVANDDGLPLGNRTLNYDVSFTPPSANLVPANDAIETAREVILNKSSRVKNYEYATENASDPTPSCASRQPSGSIWYTFSGVAGTTLITAEGSVIGVNSDSYPPGPSVAVYFGAPGSLAFVGCDDSSGINGAGRLTISASSVLQYYVMVYYDYANQDVTVPSTVKLLVVPPGIRLDSNGNFDDGLTGWIVKNASGDGLASDNGTPGNNNAFRFVGGPGEASQLKQNLLLPSNLYIPAFSLLQLNYAIRANTALPPRNSIKFEFKLIYADGAVVKIKQSMAFPAGLLVTNGFAFQFLIERKAPVKIQFAVKSTATSGVVAIDEIDILVKALNASRDITAGVLPLPAGPAGR